MAASIPKVRPGLRHVAKGSVKADVLALLLDHFLKGNADESIAIAEIVEATGDTHAHVVQALFELQLLDLISFPKGTSDYDLLGRWDEVGSFYVTQPKLRLTWCTSIREDKDKQQKLNFDESEDESDDDKAPIIFPSREERLWDRIEADQVWYRVDLSPVYQGDDSDGLLKVDFMITAADFPSDLCPIPDPVLKYEGEAETVHAAFEFWDAWKAEYEPSANSEADQPDDVLSWLKGLTYDCFRDAGAVDSYFVDRETFDAALEAWRDEFPDSTDLGLSRKIASTHAIQEREFHLDEGALIREANSGGTAHRWPGLQWEEFVGTPSMAECSGDDSESEPDEGTFSVDLEDGSSVEVSVSPVGRGSYDVTFRGPIAESGEVADRRVPKSKHGDDLSGWALKRAEKLRADYVRSQQGAA